MAEAEKKVPASVDEYINQYPADRRDVMEKARAVIKAAAPDATEKISWAMPTYHQKENLVHFAMNKNHLGFYPSPGAIEAFAKELEGYKTSKGGIQFPLAGPIPYDLIRAITEYRVRQVTEE